MVEMENIPTGTIRGVTGETWVRTGKDYTRGLLLRSLNVFYVYTRTVVVVRTLDSYGSVTKLFI